MKTHMNGAKACFSSALVIIVLLAAGCPTEPGDRDEDLVKPDVTEIEYEYFETTKIFSSGSRGIEDEIVSLSTETGELVFTDSSEYAAGLEVNDVVAFGKTSFTPNAYVGLITAVETVGETVVVGTEPKGIEFAYEYLDIYVERRFEMPDPTGRGLSKEVGIDWYPFNGDNDTATPEDQVHLHGTLTGTLDYSIEVGIDWPEFDVWPPKIDVVPDAWARMSVGGGMEAALIAEGAVAKGFHKEISLLNIPLPTIPAGLIWFDPSVEIVGKLDGGATSSFYLALAGGGSVGAAVKLGTGSLPDFDLGDPEVFFESSGLKTHATAYVRASAGPRLHMRVCSLAGPYASILAYALLEADAFPPAGEPCWEIKAGIDGDMGVDIDAFGITIFDWNTDFDIAEVDIASGYCSAEGGVSEGTVPDLEIYTAPELEEPEFEPWAGAYYDTVTGYHFDDSVLNLERTVEGKFLLSGSAADVLMMIDDEGNQEWARRYTWDDGLFPDLAMKIASAVTTADNERIVAAARDYGGEYRNFIVVTDIQGAVENAYRLGFDSCPPAPFEAMAMDPAGNIYTAGPVYYSDSTTAGVGILKLDAGGTPVWFKEYSGGSYKPYSLTPYDGGVLVAGDAGTSSGFVLRLDDDGNAVWAVSVGARVREVIETNDGDIAVGGLLDSGFNSRAFIMKLKPDGSHGWDTYNELEFPPLYGLDLTGLTQLSNGGYLCCGTWWTAGRNEFWTARTSSIGEFLTLDHYDNGADTAVGDVVLTDDGGAMIAFYSDSGSTDDSLLAAHVPVNNGYGYAPGWQREIVETFNTNDGSGSDYNKNTISVSTTPNPVLTNIDIEYEEAAISSAAVIVDSTTHN